MPDATYNTGGVLDGLGLRPDPISELERAVIEAAIKWREADNAASGEWSAREELARAVDALLAAREKQ